MIHCFLLFWFGALLLAVPTGGAADDASLSDTDREAKMVASPYLLDNWGGSRQALADKGLAFDAAFTIEGVTNVTGGLRRGGVLLGELSLMPTFDTEKAGWWPHGLFFASLLADFGGNPTTLVGDTQGTSNVQTSDALRIFEAWYEHYFFQRMLSVRLGLYDYNSDFYALDYAKIFLNASFGIGPEVAQTGPSIFPTTSLALRLKYQPTSHLYALATVYDGVPGAPGDPRRTAIILRKTDGLFYGVEIGLRSPEDQPDARHYKLALGAWYHATVFTDFRGQQHPVNRGLYVLGEALLIPEASPTQGLGGFVQLGFADSDRNPIATYLGTGLTYTGLLPGRDHDVLGWAMAHARHGNAFLRTQPAGTPRGG